MWTRSPPLVGMHLLDISCVSIGIFLKLHATFPNNNNNVGTTISIMDLTSTGNGQVTDSSVDE